MPFRSFLATLVLGLLGACGGGGGGEGPVRPVAFTAFSDVMPGQVVRATGISQTEQITKSSTNGQVTATTMNAADSGSTSATFTYGGTSPLTQTGLDVNAPHSSFSVLTGRSTQSVSCDANNCVSVGEGVRAVTANALGASAWNYQTFGYWLAAGGGPANVGGAISVGSATAVGSIPTTGTGSYTGRAGGLFADSGTGALLEHVSTMAATVDFAARTIDFSTTGTQTRAWGSTGGFTANANLNITTPTPFTYAAGVNAFQSGATAIVTGGGTPLSGQVTGRFYGPNAEEIGGTFSLSAGTQSMIGAFGGKK